MKRMVSNLFLSLWVLAFSTPGYALACVSVRACRMDSKLMEECLRACGAEHGDSQTSLTRPECVRLDARLASPMALAPGFEFSAPQTQLIHASPQAEPVLATLSVNSATRGPPLAAPLLFAEIPASQAPPVQL